jgi:hypothetical protein
MCVYVKCCEIRIVFDVNITTSLNKKFENDSIAQRSSQMYGCLSNLIFGIYTSIGASF